MPNYRITNGKKISDFEEKTNPIDSARILYIENGVNYYINKSEIVNALNNL